MENRSAWLDVSAGVAGDMLLAALLDAGADLARVQRAVDAVIPGAVRTSTTTVSRAGLRATKVDVVATADDAPDRRWPAIRALLAAAALPGAVRDNALAVFARLAGAEARVHGIPAEEVHFHEVGAWDSIADVVGVCAAVHDLGITSITAGRVAVGSGRVRGAHGDLAVPVPAVLELSRGWRVVGGGEGELATPTGMALVTTLATGCTDLPDLRVASVGVGAGTRDVPGRANVVRVVVGEPESGWPPEDAAEDAVVLRANVDDLDPRVWPGVLATLLDAGASDAWLVPILMKKGRPAHTLHVLAPPERTDRLRDLMFTHTTTLGVRESPVRKTALDRCVLEVAVGDGHLPVKVGHRDDVIVSATPEYEDAAAMAARTGTPLREVLRQADAAARRAGLVQGASLPRPGSAGDLTT
ncbi:nickel pincer cofactor biosynthesis protein LarC [Planosporangium mesophilum]|uniref:Pyridinium-3,5-bisthiocarboxylic acid mononucleotide nickel insertion protein n=1 Tax=Planosporangium mesophilum TaxID=689768 RepID=A0A8J3TA13_9ACTN|nr:nickel pincer cofactor biosynthesis protein LarC [Planosporangium mesophilum]NJC84003.1 nickel pincer cofactor biosynthesis protein LarC [Planosporangium mesophilum]GII22628.1 UPF0272 protein Cgl2470/cg2715 [Planosporangium mesophilum]